MVNATAQPTLGELNSFIAKIKSFPISAGQLLKLAHEKKAPSDVVNFYRNFAPDRVFEDKEDLAASSEQVDIMRQEEREMPREEERSPEEY